MGKASAFPQKKKAAFTLAEVLITLGIIGVVAAMTLPNLIAKYEKKQTAVAVKKVYSELCQVIQRAEADYGDFKSWKKDGSLEGCREFVNTYIKPYYKGYKMLADGNRVELWDKNSVSGNGINGILSNGTIISIAVGDDNLYVLIDVNGFKKPNKMGRDIFYFNTVTGKLMPSGWQSNLTREMALNGYTINGYRYSCKKSKTNADDDFTDVSHACTSLLMLDGWEFKNDYPW